MRARRRGSGGESALPLALARLEYVQLGDQVLLRVHGSWYPGADGERPPLTLLVEQGGRRQRLLPLPAWGARSPDEAPAGRPWALGFRAPARVIEQGSARFFLEVGVEDTLALPDPVELEVGIAVPAEEPSGAPPSAPEPTDPRLDALRDEAREAEASARGAWLRVDAEKARAAAAEARAEELELRLTEAEARAKVAEVRAIEAEALLAAYQERLEATEGEVAASLAAEERRAASERELADARAALASALFASGSPGEEGSPERLNELVQRQAAARQAREDGLT